MPGMSDGPGMATGMWDAIIGDLVLGLGLPDPLALSRDERLAAIRLAVENGRIPESRVVGLRNAGLLPGH